MTRALIPLACLLAFTACSSMSPTTPSDSKPLSPSAGSGPIMTPSAPSPADSTPAAPGMTTPMAPESAAPALAPSGYAPR